MAESGSCNVLTNNQSSPSQLSVVQRVNLLEETNEKTETAVRTMEPLLLEDYRYGEPPATMRRLLAHLAAGGAPTREDLLAAFLYLLMLEAGFVDAARAAAFPDARFHLRRLLELSRALPAGWRQGDAVRRFEFALPPLAAVCALTCVRFGEDVLVNGLVEGVANVSVLLDPLAYIASSQTNAGHFTFQGLNQLAVVFKNAIANPIKMAILYENGGLVYVCLQNLPVEVQLHILRLLEVKDLMNLARTSKFYCFLIRDKTLWVNLLGLEFKRRRVRKSTEEILYLYNTKYAKDLDRIWRTLNK